MIMAECKTNVLNIDMLDKVTGGILISEGASYCPYCNKAFDAGEIKYHRGICRQNPVNIPSAFRMPPPQ